ncbi:NADAR family protein [Chryseobacterium indologenes]|uniref:NADAR family protein n=1 Tax=Chryseobacterium indologenes TaxID=253 RepID=UPI00257646D8|nr:NADAR family protein [Chryseobacterium indologenes]MDM1556104.1 NADAR family protein [Chryseobacterium indologenes]
MNPSIREYNTKEIITFAKTENKFGGLSNMAPGYSLFINEVNIQSTEILYQACKFPLFPMIQKEIIETKNPMDAKSVSRKYQQFSRQDWDSVKFKVMKWCLEVKLIQNFDNFSELLLSTGEKTIVEFSKKDTIWGASPLTPTLLKGQNALGRLLMELREKIKSNIITKDTVILEPQIKAFLLYDNPIKEIHNDNYFIDDLDDIYAC